MKASMLLVVLGCCCCLLLSQQAAGARTLNLDDEASHVDINKGTRELLSACSWSGHCLGDPCRTYNDCDGSLICTSGKCSSPTSGPTPTPTPSPTTTTTCSWPGHCLGASCSTYNDCDGDLICTSGKCSSPTSGPTPTPTPSPTTTTTGGFCAPPPNALYTIQYPWNLNQADRYSLQNCEHDMKVYSSDAPFQQGSSTLPRTEMRINNDYTSGTHAISFDMYVESGTDAASLMQVFGGATASTALQLRVYNGNLQRYNSEVLAQNIYNQWLSLIVTHDTATGNIYVSVGAQRFGPFQDRGSATHYFKLGVYAQTGASSYMGARYRNINILS